MGHRAVMRAWIAVLLAASWGLAACSGGPDAKTGAGPEPTLPAATPAPVGAAPPPPADSPTGASAKTGETTSVTPTPVPTRPPGRDSDATPTARPPGKPESLTEKAKQDHTLIVIDEPSPRAPESLADAARRTREERGEAPRRKIVITDDNLAEYATGQLTVAAPASASSAGSGARNEDGSTDDGSTDDLGDNEDHWRQGARELRLKLRRAWDEAKALAETAAGLRTRFYAEDDPYVRDARIKPAWDRALDGQRQAELEVKATRRELAEFLEAGRRAGALPGWLREGIEHEPDFGDEQEAEDTEAVDGFDRHRSVEPERMENPSRPPGR